MMFVNDMAAEADKIAAVERLGVLMDMAAATGNLEERAHRRHMADLHRQARGASMHRDPEGLTRRQPAPASLPVASFGIGVVYVDADGNEVARPETVSADG